MKSIIAHTAGNRIFSRQDMPRPAVTGGRYPVWGGKDMNVDEWS